MSNILLLEDDLSLINGLSFAFKKQGFELNIARTLKEAEKLWTDGKYDLLVLDISLPDGSGRVRLDLAAQIVDEHLHRAHIAEAVLYSSSTRTIQVLEEKNVKSNSQ